MLIAEATALNKPYRERFRFVVNQVLYQATNKPENRSAKYFEMQVIRITNLLKYGNLAQPPPPSKIELIDCDPDRIQELSSAGIEWRSPYDQAWFDKLAVLLQQYRRTANLRQYIQGWIELQWFPHAHSQHR